MMSTYDKNKTTPQQNKPTVSYRVWQKEKSVWDFLDRQSKN